MSWDENHYKATCRSCGHVGIKVVRSDELGNTENRWSGFDTVAASDYEHLRRRSESHVPICNCGSKSIVTGRAIPR